MAGLVEVHVSLPGGTFRVGTLHRTPYRDRETVSQSFAQLAEPYTRAAEVFLVL